MAVSWCVTTAVIIWAISVTVYVGVMVGIWKKIFDIDWNDSQCVVTGIKNHMFTYVSDEETVKLHYATLSVKVSSEGVWMKGFACGVPSSHSTTMGGYAVQSAYPYTYGTCPYPDVCGNEVLQPTWYCSDCKFCDEYLTGEQVDCKWRVIDTSDSVSSADEWPQSAEIDSPRKGSSYVQVVLDAEVYYPKGEFIVLQVLGGIGIVLLPVVFLFWVLVLRCRK